MEESTFIFAEAWYIAAGLLITLAAALLLIRLRKKNLKALENFTSETLLPRLLQGFSNKRRTVKALLLIMAALSIFLALARPQKGFHWEELSRKGIDILIAVDTSQSMLANDTYPNRLERSKLALVDFVSKLEGDRIGLIPFSGTAFLMVPLTLDYDAFLDSLQALHPKLLPVSGTNIASAIEEAKRALSKSPNQKILVIISDGEDLEASGLEAAKEAAAESIKIFTIGVGSAAGELIPIKSKSGNTGFLKDEAGNVVKSKLDEETLRQIADLTKGAYYPLGQSGEGLLDVYAEKLHLLPKEDFSQRMKRVPFERFEWCILASIIFLMWEFGLRDRPGDTRLSILNLISSGRRSLQKKRPLSSFLFQAVLLCTLSFALSACGKSAQESYDQEEYADAAAALTKLLEKDPENAPLHYNLGAANYKDSKFKDAEDHFNQSLKTEDLALQEKAYYNKANALFRQGEETLAADKNKTIENWKSSLEGYKAALNLNSKNDDAKFNHDFVEKKLKELIEEQKQNQDKKQQDQQQEEEEETKENQQTEPDQEKQESKQTQSTAQMPDATQSPQAKDEKQQDEKKTEESERLNQQESQTEHAPTPSQERPLPGKADKTKPQEMSKEEAQALLDSLRNEEQLVLPESALRGPTEEQAPLKNW